MTFTTSLELQLQMIFLRHLQPYKILWRFRSPDSDTRILDDHHNLGHFSLVLAELQIPNSDLQQTSDNFQDSDPLIILEPKN